jgi:hemolysin activation/secretion protein
VLGNLLGRPGGRDELQLLAFFDYGSVEVIDALPEDGDDPDKTLASVGGGLRWTVSRNFSLRFDYGFPLQEKDLNERSARGHIGALLSF